MTHSRSYGLLSFTVLVLAILAVRTGTRTDRDGASAPTLLTTPLVQQGKAVVQALTLDPSRVTTPATRAIVRPDIRGPVRIETGVDGHLFVIDDGSQETIYEFSPDGVFIQEFRGGGVPKIKSVTDISSAGDQLWITDLLGSAIHMLNRQSGTWTTVVTKEEPYRLEPVGLGLDRLIIMRVGLPRLFDITDPSGSVLQSFGTLLEDQAYHSLVLDGFITSAGPAIIFSGKELGLLASFGIDGTLYWTANLIAPPEIPVTVRLGNKRWVEHRRLQASESVAASQGVVGVLSRRVDGLKVSAFIDCYRSLDGSYYKSLKLPVNGEWMSLAVGDHDVFAANTKGIYRWPVEIVRESSTSLLSAGQLTITFSDTKGENR